MALPEKTHRFLRQADAGDPTALLRGFGAQEVKAVDAVPMLRKGKPVVKNGVPQMRRKERIETRPYSFDPLTPPAELEGLKHGVHYEHYLSPSGVAMKKAGLGGGIPFGWRLTAKGRAAAKKARGNA